MERVKTQVQTRKQITKVAGHDPGRDEGVIPMVRLTRPFFVPASWGKGAAAFFCRTALLPVCLTLLLSGCAQLPIAGPDASRLTSMVVTRLDAEPLFAAAPGGRQVAFSSGGVRVMPLPSGEPRSLSAERP
ncbi:MAG: hypothetical protein WCD00_03115, partial [Desulfuromonadaceae bacterium]